MRATATGLLLGALLVPVALGISTTAVALLKSACSRAKKLNQ